MLDDKQRETIEEAVKTILTTLGEDIQREGLKETPERVARMYEEVFSSLQEPEFTNYKVFDSLNEEDMVIVKEIEFYSMCEHHLLPFFGKVHVAYIPKNQQVLGLSKIPRMVDYCAKRPNVQENLTIQIANLVAETSQAQGVAVMVEAQHLCMAMRGIKTPHSTTQTTHFKGCFKENRDLQQDFIQAIRL